MAGTSRYSSYNCLNSWDSYDKIPRYNFTCSTFILLMLLEYKLRSKKHNKLWWFTLIIDYGYMVFLVNENRIKLSMSLKRLNCYSIRKEAFRCKTKELEIFFYVI